MPVGGAERKHGPCTPCLFDDIPSKLGASIQSRLCLAAGEVSEPSVSQSTRRRPTQLHRHPDSVSRP